jgi:hypothetical protein
LEACTSRYHEVYARWQRDPEGFWAEAARPAAGIYQRGNRSRFDLGPLFVVIIGPSLVGLPAISLGFWRLRWPPCSRNRSFPTTACSHVQPVQAIATLDELTLV